MQKRHITGLLFRSRREPMLWGVTLLSLLPVVLAVWLLTLNGGAEAVAEFGGAGAWVFRGALVLVSSVLFWPMGWLSGRYVLRAENTPGKGVTFVTWTLLGRRRRVWPGASPNPPAIWFEEDKKRSGRLFRFMRGLLRNLIGRRERLSPGGSILHEGRTHIPGRVWVDAPYISLYPAGEKQLVLDMQGEFPHGQDALLQAVMN